jgi:hypothetical protein
MAEVPMELVHDYLVGTGVGRGLRTSDVHWKYFDEDFNRGRERGYVWFKDNRVRGFIGWIPAKVTTPAGDSDMVWTCDWSVEDPTSNPGIGILLLARVQKRYGFVGGVGGSADTNSLVPQMRTRTVEGNAVQLRCPLRVSLILERIESKLPVLGKLSESAIGQIKLPRRRVACSTWVTFSRGVDATALAPLFDRPATDQCRVRYEAAHLAWLGRYPGADFETAYLTTGSEAAGAVLWRLHRAPHRWRIAIRASGAGAALVGPLIAAVLERLERTSANIVSTIVSSHDEANLEHLKRQGFIESAQRMPLYIPEYEGAAGCRDGFSEMSFLDTDFMFND